MSDKPSGLIGCSHGASNEASVAEAHSIGTGPVKVSTCGMIVQGEGQLLHNLQYDACSPNGQSSGADEQLHVASDNSRLANAILGGAVNVCKNCKFTCGQLRYPPD